MMDAQREDTTRLLLQQQDILAEHTGLLERQRQDMARLTEVIAQQQKMMADSATFQQKLLLRNAPPDRGKQQLLEPPALPGHAGGR